MRIIILVEKIDQICQSIDMNNKISHDRRDESIEAKVLWFRSLSLSERMDLLCDFTDLALELNPRLPEIKYAQQTKERVQIISAT